MNNNLSFKKIMENPSNNPVSLLKKSLITYNQKLAKESINKIITDGIEPIIALIRQYNSDELIQEGISPYAIRLSVGLENSDLLIDDLKQAFAHL